MPLSAASPEALDRARLALAASAPGG
jgi:hypothetical protein